MSTMISRSSKPRPRSALDLHRQWRVVDPKKVRSQIDAGDLAAGPLGRPDRPEQGFDLRRQLGGADSVPEGAQDSIVLSVGIARRQPIRAVNFHSPAQERKTVRRGLPVADERPVDVDVNVHLAAITDPQPFALRKDTVIPASCRRWAGCPTRAEGRRLAAGCRCVARQLADAGN